MIPKTIFEKLVGNNVYIYIRNMDREFGGILESITKDDIAVLKDKYNNLIHIPLDIIDVITERR
ncbi:MAG: hypothetical protein ACFFD5_09275 [Candidatus Thorarchaeota archaeon]